VGDDDVGREIVDGLAREGVDVSELAMAAGARSPRSTILVEHDARAIVHFPGTLPPLELSAAAHGLCERAEWVHVDHVGYRAAPEGVRLSVDGGIPIDGLDLRRVALYAPPESMDDGRRAELTVVTRGARGSVAYTADETIEAPGVPVDAVSTLGAGDVFHGALLAALVRREPLPRALALANECAAISCRALDGRSAIPTWEELLRG
jgi:sugar/nucleoside kinase (ribokinase family)